MIREGNGRACGVPGSPISIAHTLYNNAYHFLDGNLLSSARGPALALFGEVLQRLIEGENPTSHSLSDKFEVIAESIKTGKVLKLTKPGSSSLVREITSMVLAQAFQEELHHVIEAKIWLPQIAFAILKTKPTIAR